VPFVSTVHNIADFFTKALPPDRFTAMRDTIMNVPTDDETSRVVSDHGGALRENVLKGFSKSSVPV
jgi:hypothetical protein